MEHYQTVTRNQRELKPGQIRNEAGGAAYAADRWDRLSRFLILGVTGNTFYVGKRDLTLQNIDVVDACIAEDAERVLQMCVDISLEGRAKTQDPVLFTLAKLGSLAYPRLNELLRTGTHLLNYVAYASTMRGWGRSFKRAVAEWFTSKDPADVAFQAVKYQQRDGWSMRDLLRLAHPQSEAHNPLFKWIVSREIVEGCPQIIRDFETAKSLSGVALAKHVEDAGLTREMVPTESLKDSRVWGALRLPYIAMLRNLSNMAECGYMKPMSEEESRICERLTDIAEIQKSRVHPLQILLASTYFRGAQSKKLTNALGDAFIGSYRNVTPTGKRIAVAVDSSGSMSWGMAGSTKIAPLQAAAALASIWGKTEENVIGFAFDTRIRAVDLDASPETVARNVGDMGGGTDCSLPARAMLQAGIVADALIIITDEQSWSGPAHVDAVMSEYRRRLNPDAKMVVLALQPTRGRLTEPGSDKDYSIVGFDAGAHALVNELIGKAE